MADHFPDKNEFKEQFHALLNPEAGFYKVVLIYSIAISLLTLAVPISLQLLVDTVANIALVRAVILIALLLFFLLFLSGVMYAFSSGYNFTKCEVIPAPRAAPTTIEMITDKLAKLKSAIMTSKSAVKPKATRTGAKKAFTPQPDNFLSDTLMLSVIS